MHIASLQFIGIYKWFLFRGVFNKYILLLFYYGYRTEQANSLIWSTWLRSASDVVDKSKPSSFILLLTNFIIVFEIFLVPKFFRTSVLGKMTPQSTQQTEIFSCPISTTQAELIAFPKQARMLYKCKYKRLNPIFPNIIEMNCLICFRIKTSGKTITQLKVFHSFSGIFNFYFNMYFKSL